MIVDGKVIVEDGTLYMERKQDIAPILEMNHQRLTTGDGYTPSRDMRHVATIPLIVLEQWMKEGLDFTDPNDTPEILRRLNNGEWARLRTSEGKL